MGYRRVKDPTEVVVLFRIQKREEAREPEYEETDRRMVDIVSAMPGFLSYKHFRSDDGEDVGIVRFGSEADLDAWHAQPEHRKAQARARERWYDRYHVQVCRVVREYEWTRGPEAT